ncbi:MAG TPA: hypothetical protein VH500_04245 [Nitrososphaeraceae archaeon]
MNLFVNRFFGLRGSFKKFVKITISDLDYTDYSSNFANHALFDLPQCPSIRKERRG